VPATWEPKPPGCSLEKLVEFLEDEVLELDRHSRWAFVELQGDQARLGSNGRFIGHIDGQHTVDEVLQVAALRDDSVARSNLQVEWRPGSRRYLPLDPATSIAGLVGSAPAR